MRAIAVLCVVIVHVAFFAAPGTVPAPAVLFHLNIGVTIFFLISGFLLYRPFIAHRAGGPPAPAIAKYARRRVLRIFPAYWLVLTALTLLPEATGVSSGDWLSQYSLLHTIPLTDRTESCSSLIFDCGLAQTWSLVVELSFYAALPLWFVLSERLSRGRTVRNWASIEIAGLGIIALISGALHYGSTSPITLVGGTLIGFSYWFALGMGLAVASVALESSPRKPRAVDLIARRSGTIWLVAIAAYLGLSAWLDESAFVLVPGRELVAHIAFGAIAFLLMLPAVFGDDDGGGAARRILANPAVAWIGLVSYGIFLWHYVVAQWLGNTPSQSDFLPPGSGDSPLNFWPLLGATLGITIAIAALSYYVVERPLLRFKR